MGKLVRTLTASRTPRYAKAEKGIERLVQSIASIWSRLIGHVTVRGNALLCPIYTLHSIYNVRVVVWVVGRLVPFQKKAHCSADCPPTSAP